MTYADDYIDNLSADLNGSGAFASSTACTGASNSVVTSLNLLPGTAQFACHALKARRAAVSTWLRTQSLRKIFKPLLHKMASKAG
jgi:hypothetical protein